MMYSKDLTPEDMASMIDTMANDRAARIKAISRSAVVMVTTPEWVRAEEALACFGLPPNQLKEMVIRGDVIAKKMDRTMPTSAVIYKVETIRRAIDNLPDYKQWLADRQDDLTTKGDNNNE